MPYQVQLESFYGPLDLLLYLVKRDEVDILSISIHKLAEQFLDYLQVLKEFDVEMVGDFLVMAATLMEIKSRSLIASPEDELSEQVQDTRQELVKQLLEYRKYKDAAKQLEQAAEKQAKHFRRWSTEEAVVKPTTLRTVEIWDLVSAFARLMRETQPVQTQIQVDDTPQQVYEEQLRTLLAERIEIAFQDVFPQPCQRYRLIGYFLALLELCKLGQVRLEQPEPFAEIRIFWQRQTPDTASQPNPLPAFSQPEMKNEAFSDTS